LDPSDLAGDFPISLSELILKPLAELLLPAFEFDPEPEDFAASRFPMKRPSPSRFVSLFVFAPVLS
jgi:hypothetical protein